MIALMQPRESWVARWNKLTTRCPGLYAISTGGDVEEENEYEEDDEMRSD